MKYLAVRNDTPSENTKQNSSRVVQSFPTNELIGQRYIVLNFDLFLSVKACHERHHIVRVADNLKWA